MNNYLTSRLCTYEEFNTPSFKYWTSLIKDPHRAHRKLWEFCAIAQALDVAGMLKKGKRGLGLAC